MNSAREKILNKLPDTEITKTEYTVSENIYAKGEGSLLNIFKSEIELVDGEVFIVDDKKNLNIEINNYLKNNTLSKIYSNYPDLRINNDFKLIKEFSTEIEVAITTCEYLSARTGSVVLSSHNDGRKINIFAPIHIVIANENQILPDIDDCIVSLTKKYDKLPSSISFATGPSRTADIEKTLILGAHGPKKLSVFIIKNSE